ncbi:MAG: zinc-binding dehydrogenase [Kofleriaceae bacterium]|nr:zinc-binding dehydrogenase [Kofleriaceae bacterium]
MTKAIRASSGTDALRIEDVPTPTPGPDDVRIRVHAAGLNYTDALLVAGLLPSPAPMFTPGVEVAGVIDAIGSGVSGLRVGQRVVATLPELGGFAEEAIAAASRVVGIADSLAFERAVAVPVLAPTTLLVLRASRLAAGETLFVPSAAGAAGTLLVQLAKRVFGAKVVAGASSEEKRELALGLGADIAVDTSHASWSERVREGTAGRGADVVLLREGGDVPAASLRALGFRGRLVVFGVDNMFDTAFTKEQVGSLLAQNQAVIGVATFSLPEAEVQAAVREVLELVERGVIEPVVSHVVELAEVRRAMHDLRERRTSGKVVVRVRA